jgi:Amt family ammonium transporter
VPVADLRLALARAVGSGFVYYGATELLLFLRIDDPLEAAPVHFFGGMWGLFCIGALRLDAP